MSRGSLIVFEGIEGSGKTTQTKLLRERLEAAGVEVVTTFEPGATPLGESLRSLVLGDFSASGAHGSESEGRSVVGRAAADPTSYAALDRNNPTPLAELFLYLADRAEHVSRVVSPALASGKVVVCDRFVDSTVAYQGVARGLGPALVRQLSVVASGGIEPDLVVVLDLEPEEALARLRHRGSAPDAMEREPLEFHRTVRSAYLEIAAQDPGRYVVVNATASPNEVSDQVFGVVVERLRRRVGTP